MAPNKSKKSKTEPQHEQPSTSVAECQDLLASSKRILALCGAGLSASSGLPTFRGAGGLWRNHESTSLATPAAFEKDPALVWLFYAWRRHMALSAKPNAGHVALAELAGKKEGFLCLTQNVDGKQDWHCACSFSRSNTDTCQVYRFVLGIRRTSYDFFMVPSLMSNASTKSVATSTSTIPKTPFAQPWQQRPPLTRPQTKASRSSIQASPCLRST